MRAYLRAENVIGFTARIASEMGALRELEAAFHGGAPPGTPLSCGRRLAPGAGARQRLAPGARPGRRS